MSDFMEQFRAGFQMGQSRNENARRNQELQMEQARQAQEQERRAAAFQLQQEEFKLRKKQLAAEEHASRLAAAKEAFQMKTQAASMQGLPVPTAADVGVPEQGPDMAGPPAAQINVPQPMMQMPNPQEGGPDIGMPILTGRQQQEMAQAAQQAKMREALGLLDAQEGIKASYREKPKGLEEIFAEAKARAAGGRAGAPLASASGSMTGEGGKPLLSGEINRLTEIDSALGEAENLKQTVTSIKGGTGALAGAQAMLPNPVVQALSGAGVTGPANAKKRQATIKLAKQIIGKGLEGGVLRKEDEYKYEQILPTMTDGDDIAAGKVEQLIGALQRKRTAELENLELAGRNVTKFKEKAASSRSKFKIIEVK